MSLPTPPAPLVRGALSDPELREVLADWYETHGEGRWAAMVRGELRWSEVRGALKDAGLSVRRMESPFFWLDDDEPRLGMPAHFTFENMENLHVERHGAGWVANIQFRKVPKGKPDCVGTPDAAPFKDQAP